MMTPATSRERLAAGARRSTGPDLADHRRDCEVCRVLTTARDALAGAELGALQGTARAQRQSNATSAHAQRLSPHDQPAGREDISMSTALFGLGQLVATPGALDDLRANGQTAAQLIERHIAGDFGDVGEGDAEANRQDIADGNGPRAQRLHVLADGNQAMGHHQHRGRRGQDTCVLRPRRVLTATAHEGRGSGQTGQGRVR